MVVISFCFKRCFLFSCSSGPMPRIESSARSRSSCDSSHQVWGGCIDDVSEGRFICESGLEHNVLDTEECSEVNWKVGVI